MINKIHNNYLFEKDIQIIDYIIVSFFLILTSSFYSQVTFNKIPLDKQLVARDANNKGIVIFEGTSDRSSGSESNYEAIQIDVKRNGSFYGSFIEILNYTGDIASFKFIDIEIDSELANYSFEIYGKIGSNFTIITLPDDNNNIVEEVIAGDIFIIQGQSNAEARMRDGSANENTDPFIRVYANGTDDDSDLLNNNAWYIAQGDGKFNSNGNVGQWGLKLAKLLVDSENIPIAVFNGGRGPKWIDYFQKNYDGDPEPSNNYERMLYRLKTTGLKNNVKAVFWSQGETLNDIYSVDDYYDAFINLKNSWLDDYPGIEKFYIFQTTNGCGNVNGSIEFDRLMYTKEAQRRLAAEQSDIQIMSIDGFARSSDDCHFKYTNGYEDFATRIFRLVKRDFYGASISEIDPPDITDAYLMDDITLILETNASTLYKDAIADTFQLEDANGEYITGISISGNKIIMTLSNNPGAGASISNVGAGPGETDRFVRCLANGIELLSFNKYQIDNSRFTIWDGGNWSNDAPNREKYTIINGDYSVTNGNIEALNLTVNSDLNFKGGTVNSVVVYGDLTVNATFTIGDKESLVMYKDNATIIGEITKLENSTSRSNIHDFTYWSSPVSSDDAQISNVFEGVNPNRIFYYDQSQSAATENSDPTYWNVWQIASGNMTSGLGYAAEGIDDEVHSLSFIGKPNNGDITVSIVNQDPGNDFNLIGNPYPSAIDIVDFFTVNTNLDGTAYLWTHNTEISGGSNGDFVADDYASINSEGGTTTCLDCETPKSNIGSAQGFFVNAESGSSIIFTNDMRIEDANNQFFKLDNFKDKAIDEKEKDRIWLNLTTDEGGFNQLLIGFTNQATKGIDKGYDALKFTGSSNPISFYSQIEDQKYVIQSLSTFSKDKKISLGFDTTVSRRKFTIGISKSEGLLKGVELYLVDHDLNIIHDLKVEDYEFKEMVAGENLNRFTLQFDRTALSVDKIISKKDFIILAKQNGFEVNSKINVEAIKVYDILGRIIINDNPNKKFFKLETKNCKAGTILFIEAILENHSVVSRKFIKL